MSTLSLTKVQVTRVGKDQPYFLCLLSYPCFFSFLKCAPSLLISNRAASNLETQVDGKDTEGSPPHLYYGCPPSRKKLSLNILRQGYLSFVMWVKASDMF